MQQVSMESIKSAKIKEESGFCGLFLLIHSEKFHEGSVCCSSLQPAFLTHQRRCILQHPDMVYNLSASVPRGNKWIYKIINLRPENISRSHRK